MTRLSVNLNKVALLRNSRNIGIPSVLKAAELSVGAGAHGITVHPRPDRRHIRPSDVYDLADFLKHYPHVEFNIEGNPFPDFMEMSRGSNLSNAHSFLTARMRSLQITVGTLTKRAHGSNRSSLN